MHRRNDLLAKLPQSTIDRIKPHLQMEDVQTGMHLYAMDSVVGDLFFPTRHAVISLITVADNGGSVEFGMAGSEAVVGLPALLNGGRSNHEAVVQLPGQVLKIKAAVLLREFWRDAALQERVLRYTHGLLTQISQIALCNRLHDIEARMARCFLFAHYRSGVSEFPWTHETLARMLGARRATISVAAANLESERAIQNERGLIKIVDSHKLSGIACGCLQVIRREYDRLFPAN